MGNGDRKEREKVEKYVNNILKNYKNNSMLAMVVRE